MDSEYASLLKQHTWFLVPLSTSKNWFLVNGYIKLRGKVMELLLGIRLDWWPKGFCSNMDWTIRRLLVLM